MQPTKAIPHLANLCRFLVCISALLSSGMCAAELVKIDDDQVRKEYRALSATERAEADKLFIYSIYDPERNLRGAYSAGLAIHNAKSAGPEAYKRVFNGEWAVTMTIASRAPLAPRPPSNPLQADGEWAYGKVIQRAMHRESLRNDSLTQVKIFSAIGEYAGPGYWARGAKALGKLFTNSDENSSQFVSRYTIQEEYKTAIALVKAMKGDGALASATRKLLTKYEGKELLPLMLREQLIGKEAPPNGEIAQTVKTEIKNKNRQVLERFVKEQKEGKTAVAHTSDNSKEQSVDRRSELNFYIDEYEGGARLLALLLQQHDPKAAKSFTILTNTIVQAGRLYNTPGIGPLALAGGYATIFVAFIQASEQQGTAEVTFQQLNEIRASLQDLRKEVRTGFSELDNKVDRMFALTTLNLAAIEEVVSDIKRLELQSNDKLDLLSTQAESVVARTALATHRRASADLVAEVDRACSLTTAPKNACKDRLLFELASGTRRLATLLGKEIESTPEIYDVAFASEDMDALNILNIINFSRDVGAATVNYGRAKVGIPPGLPSPDTWLQLVARLRAQVSLNKLAAAPSDRELLEKIASDGDELARAYERLGVAVTGELWNEYLSALSRVDELVRKVAYEHSVFADSLGVPFATWEFCGKCPEILAAKSPSIDIYGLSIWSERKATFERFDDFFAIDISKYTNETPEEFHLLSEAPNAVLVSYDSLPANFRAKLGIPYIEILHRLSVGRLYAVVNNVRSASPLTGLKEGPCDEVMRGPLCNSNAAMWANIKIVFATGPFESDEFIAKSVADLTKHNDLSFRLRYIEQFALSGGRRTIPLLELEVQRPIRTVLTPMPEHRLNIRQPTLAGLLHYVRLHISDGQNLGALKRTGQQATVERLFQTADNHRLQVVGDMVRALGIGSALNGSSPARLAISGVQMSGLQRAAREVRAVGNRWYAGAMFLNLPLSEKNPGIRQAFEVARRCRLSHEGPIGLLSRPSAYLTPPEQLIVTIGQQTRQSCEFPDNLARVEQNIQIKDEFQAAAAWIRALK